MNEINLRKKKFYSSVMRSFIWLVVLLMLLAITDINIAKALLTLLIVGILLNFTYVAETQLPFIAAKVPQSGLIVSSAVHIGIIFITYINLLEVVTENNNVKQVFNIVFLLLLCIPLFRGGKALYDGIDGFANQIVNGLDESQPSISTTSQSIVCKNCNTENTLSTKYCIECGNSLQESILCPQCGEKNLSSAKFCGECGTKLIQTTSLTETSTKKEPIKIFKFSIAHPRAVSKRFDSIFLCQIYLPESRSRALRNIKSNFQEKPVDEQIKRSSIKFDQKVTVKLESNNFSFSESITKFINNSLIEFVIKGRPNDNCETGNHDIKASVIDAITGEELDYLMLKRVHVVDFAFDHISRPLLSKTSTVVLGIGSFAMFILTFLEQIDKTIGLTSGTAVGVLAIIIYTNFYNLYQRIHPSSSL